MFIADHNFRGHVNVPIYSTWWGERGLRFEVDASTEGGRCLVLLIVYDLSVVTACCVVIMTFILRFLIFFTVSVILFKISLIFIWYMRS